MASSFKWSDTARTAFDDPGRAAVAMLAAPRNHDGPWVFATSAPITHRRRAPFTGTASAHGWYAINVLGLAPHLVAEQLDHKDSGKLVFRKAMARRTICEAHDAAARVVDFDKRLRKDQAS